MDGYLKSLLVCALFAGPTTVLADDDEAYRGYDSIVSELKMAADEPVIASDDWEEVAIHGGAGLIASRYNIYRADGAKTLSANGMMTGFQLHFGVNLFTKHARMEGVFRNYNSETARDGFVVDLKEFEFRAIYLPSLADQMKWRLGGGLSARYMTLNSDKVSTPAMSLLAGFERALTPTVSFGPDLSYRYPLVSDTFDRASFDASLKVNATF
jgi:hypothetical protein